MSTQVEIGERIRRLRVAAGMSQQALAEPELSASYLSRIESGDRQASPKLLVVLAERLGTTLEYLTAGIEVDLRDQTELLLRLAAQQLASGDLAGARASATALDDVSLDLAGAGFAHERDALRARLLEAAGNQADALMRWDALNSASAVASPLWFESAIAVVRIHRHLGDLLRSGELGEALVRRAQDVQAAATTEGVRLQMTVMFSFLERGDLAHAQLLADRARLDAEALGDPAALTAVYWNTSALLAEQGDVRGAAALAQRAVDAAAVAARPFEVAAIQMLQAHCLTRLGEPTAAQEALAAAAPVVTAMGSPHSRVYLHLEFARAAIGLGQRSEALDQTAAVIENEDASELQRAEALVLRAQGLRVPARGKDAEAAEAASAALQDAARLMAGVKAERLAARVWLELAAAAEHAGDLAEALTAYKAACACLGAPSPERLLAAGESPIAVR